MYKDEFVDVINNDVEIVEEFLNIDESLIALEQNRDLVRMEMNIIEFPIFSRSNLIKLNQVKKYYFATDKTSYLEVIPAVGTSIPGEFEERVFIALLKIFKKSGYSPTFYCKASDILDNMNITNAKTKKAMYSKVRQAISKLTTTTFRFKNLFYSNAIQDIRDDLIETNILTYRLVSFIDANKNEKDYFTDKRIKEVYKITVSQHFYDNIIKKGYLVFDADELLNIKDSVTRSIYTMITKWRNNKLYLKRPAFYIARRVPLAWNKHSIKKTVPRIEKSLKELKEYNYITDFILHKNDKLEKAEFEIFFSEEHNKIKRDIFYDEKSDFNKMVHYEEVRLNEDIPTIDEEILHNEDDLNRILIIFGEKGAKLKTLPNVIKEALKTYEFNYVLNSAEYTTFNCKVSLIKYFKDTLLNNWADEYSAKKQIKIENKEKKKEKNIIEEAIIVEEPKSIKLDVSWDAYLELPSTLQEQVVQTAYAEYLIETGAKDNKLIKGIFEKGKKTYIMRAMEKYQTIEPKVEIIEKQDEINSKVELENKEILSEKENYSEVIGEYISVPQFMVKVREITREKNIQINFEDLVPIFKLFGEYEDEFINIKYNEISKEGLIILKK